jgi:hypothetical protein
VAHPLAATQLFTQEIVVEFPGAAILCEVYKGCVFFVPLSSWFCVSNQIPTIEKLKSKPRALTN